MICCRRGYRGVLVGPDVLADWLFFEGCEYGAQFFVGGYESGAAFGNQFGCAACE